VPFRDQLNFSLTCKSAYEYATELTWKDLILRDRDHYHNSITYEESELLRDHIGVQHANGASQFVAMCHQKFHLRIWKVD
jgi:hypothetical protein